MTKKSLLIFLCGFASASLLAGATLFLSWFTFPAHKQTSISKTTERIELSSPSESINAPWPINPDIHDIAPGKDLIIQAVGDILLARDVGMRIRQNGWAHPFINVRELTSAGDINFCNLETPASFIGTPYPGKHPNITFRAQPGSLFSLKHAGFNMISLANNHMTDYGSKALEETLDALSLLELNFAGAGKKRAEAYAPCIIEKNSWRVAFLAYADPIWSVVEASDTAGVAHIHEDEILTALKELRQSGNVDLILVSLHWGEEYRHSPLPSQRILAKRIIEAGADAILGHHPHVMQGVEWHLGKPILYSLGNFAFDQIDDPTYQSVLARMQFSPDGSITLSMRPMRIARQSLHQTIPQSDDLQMITNNITYYNKQLESRSIPLENGWIHVCSSKDPATPPDSRSDNSSIP